MSYKKVENKQEKNNQLPFPQPKPLEMKIEDAIFLKVRNNMVLFKDLSNPKVHYSAFMIGSKFDLHITLETEVDSKRKHVQLLELQVDWKFILEKMVRDLQANSSSILKKTKVHDPKWQDMEIEFISPEMLTFLLQNAAKKNRWNIDHGFFNKLESSFHCFKLEELAGHGVNVGWSAEGYLVLSNGSDCWIIDFDKLVRIMNQNLELSIRKIRLKYYTLGLLLLWLKIQLLNFNRCVVNYINKILH